MATTCKCNGRGYQMEVVRWSDGLGMAAHGCQCPAGGRRGRLASEIARCEVAGELTTAQGNALRALVLS